MISLKGWDYWFRAQIKEAYGLDLWKPNYYNSNAWLMLEALGIIIDYINTGKTKVSYATSGTCLALALNCSIEDNVNDVYNHFKDNLKIIPNLVHKLEGGSSAVGNILMEGERSLNESLTMLFGSDYSTRFEIFLDDYLEGNARITVSERNYVTRITAQYR